MSVKQGEGLSGIEGSKPAGERESNLPGGGIESRHEKSKPGRSKPAGGDTGVRKSVEGECKSPEGDRDCDVGGSSEEGKQSKATCRELDKEKGGRERARTPQDPLPHPSPQDQPPHPPQDQPPHPPPQDPPPHPPPQYPPLYQVLLCVLLGLIAVLAVTVGIGMLNLLCTVDYSKSLNV